MQLAEVSVKDFAMAGYSSTPLPQKLGIKPDSIVVAIDPPDNYRKLLGQVPSGVNFASRPQGRAALRWRKSSRRDLPKAKSGYSSTMPSTPLKKPLGMCCGRLEI